MVNQPEKENQPKRIKAKELTEQAMFEQLAECVLYVSKKDVQKEQDPFEVYACQLKARLYRKSKLFNKRFAQGYGILLEALQAMPHQS
jgi:hypothetical protein